MDIIGKKIVVVGGAGLIGSHTIDRLLKEDVKEVLRRIIVERDSKIKRLIADEKHRRTAANENLGS